MDLLLIARYPFLEASREHVRSLGISMERIMEEDHRRVQEMARDRVIGAIEGSDHRSPQVQDLEAWVLSYPLARYMVAAVSDRNLIKWFSHREAEIAADLLLQEGYDLLLEIGREMGLETCLPPSGRKDGGFQIPQVTRGMRPGGDERATADSRGLWIRLTDYLPARAHISGPEWDLSNQRLIGGKVEVNRRRYIRLMQELIKAKVESGLEQAGPIPRKGPLADLLSEIEARLEVRRKTYEPSSVGRITITRMPPCMRQLLGMSQAGENMPHHARFALVTFLHSIGMDPEEIFKVFTASPDFKEDIVRYQIEHITGRSSGTEYRVPGCDSMKSGGICHMPDRLCEMEWMNSPYVYYRAKGRRRTTSEGSTS